MKERRQELEHEAHRAKEMGAIGRANPRISGDGSTLTLQGVENPFCGAEL